MIDMYIMIWHLKFINLKTILRPSIVGGMPLKCTHVVPSLNIECTPGILTNIPYLEVCFLLVCQGFALCNTEWSL